MSILFFDDPQYYATANLATRFASAGSLTVSPGNGRFGTSSWRQTGSNSIALVNLGTSQATGTIAISLKFNGLPTGGNAVILGFEDAGTIQVTLQVTNGGNLVVCRSGSSGTNVLATSTSALSTNVWYRIEFQATINNTTGVIEVHVNGSSTGWIPNTTGLNTRNSANNTFNQIFFGENGGGTAGTVDWNDLFVTDSNSPNAGFLGDKRCYLLAPNANSSVTWTPTFASFLNNHAYALGDQFKDSNGNVQRTTTAGTSAVSGTPTWATTGGSTTTSGGATFTVVGSGSNPGATNWMAVSEPASDGDDSYNLDSNPGDIDLFGVPALPAGAQNIAAVKNILFVRKDDAGTRTVASQIKSSGTTATGASIALSTTYIYTDSIQETDPNTSAAWTASGVNAALFGYKEIA